MLVPSVGLFRVFEHYDRFVHSLSGEDVSSSEMQVLRQRAIFAWKGIEKRKDVPEELIVRIIEFAGVGESTLIFFIGKASADSLAKSNFNLFERVAQPHLGNLQSLTISRIREANALTDFPIFDERRLIPENQRPVHIGARPALSQLAINIFCATMQEGEVIEIANRIDPEFMKPTIFEDLKRWSFTIIKDYNKLIIYTPSIITLFVTMELFLFSVTFCMFAPFVFVFGDAGLLIAPVFWGIALYFNFEQVANFRTAVDHILQAEFDFFKDCTRASREYATQRLKEYQNERVEKAVQVLSTAWSKKL